MEVHVEEEEAEKERAGGGLERDVGRPDIPFLMGQNTMVFAVLCQTLRTVRLDKGDGRARVGGRSVRDLALDSRVGSEKWDTGTPPS